MWIREQRVDWLIGERDWWVWGWIGGEGGGFVWSGEGGDQAGAGWLEYEKGSKVRYEEKSEKKGTSCVPVSVIFICM